MFALYESQGNPAMRPPGEPRASVSKIDSEDGLPTAIVTVKSQKRAIKLDTGARYSIAGVDWILLGHKLPEKAPAQLVEGINGFELKVLGLWRFEFKNVYQQDITVDACVVDGCHRDFLLGEDFMMKHKATIDFSTNELRYYGR